MVTVTLVKKNKSTGGGAYFYGQKDNCVPHTHRDIRKIIKHCDVKLENCNEDLELLNIIHTLEVERENWVPLNIFKKGNVHLMNRIVRAGGMIEYVKQLEKGIVS